MKCTEMDPCHTSMIDHLRRHILDEVFMSQKDFDDLSSFFKPLFIKKKSFLHRQGETCRNIAFVHQGCLRNFHTDHNGDEQIIYFAFEDWWVADLQSFFLNVPSQFSLQAIEDCQLLISSKTEFEKALESLPKFEKFYRIKTQKAYTQTQLAVAEKAENAEERYKNLIKTSPHMIHRIPQQYLASYLGIKPQSLSRIRKKMLDSHEFINIC